jgi:hypothetical protein
VPVEAYHMLKNDALKQLDMVDAIARRAGQEINRAKTDFMIIGDWMSSLEFGFYTGTINQVLFKYLESWLISCTKYCKIGKAFA